MPVFSTVCGRFAFWLRLSRLRTSYL